MLTIITGTPGSFKSLYAVWEIARHVPGSFVENAGDPVPRKLYSNIKDLIVEHEHITAADLERWHEWAKPGDVIIFDEVQEVWRPRGLGVKVPDAIARLETHRHMGVDLVLITQHPMLIDPNIRRLVNQHLHMRRITVGVAMVYEWDHCENPGQVRTAISSRVWMRPKKAFGLYKSAQLHTKPKVRIPKAAFVLVAALVGLAWAAPNAWTRVSATFKGESAHVAQSSSASSLRSSPSTVAPSAPVAAAAAPVRSASSPGVESVVPGVGDRPRPSFSGCVRGPAGCTCFDTAGGKVAASDDVCTGLGASKPVLTAAELPDDGAPRELSLADVDALQFLRSLRGPRNAE